MSSAGLRWVRWRARLGFPLAVLCLWLARPTNASIVAGGLIAFVGLAIRAAAAGHLRKSAQVTVSGPYARTRNPLYLGSAVMAAGFAMASRSWLAAALLACYYAAFFPYLMRREEHELAALFGREFETYARSVPLFWPRLRVPARQAQKFSWRRYLENGEYNVALGMAALLALLWALARFRP